MARIRTIKPEAFASETLALLSLSAERTFFGLLTQADDEGRIKAGPEVLNGALWPLRPEHTVEDMRDDLAQLERVGLLCSYEVEGRVYRHLPTFRVHQRINRPTPSRLPPCPVHQAQQLGGQPDLLDGLASPGSARVAASPRAAAAEPAAAPRGSTPAGAGEPAAGRIPVPAATRHHNDGGDSGRGGGSRPAAVEPAPPARPEPVDTRQPVDAGDRNPTPAGGPPAHNGQGQGELFPSESTTKSGKKKRQAPKHWTGQRKEAARKLLDQWWADYGKGQSQSYVAILGVLVTALANGISADDLQHALTTLGQQKKPVSGGTIQMVLGQRPAVTQALTEQQARRNTSYYSTDL